MSADLVSVIVPTYNRVRLLDRALRSVLDQTYADLECIVVDDASTDETQSFCETHGDERLVYIRQGGGIFVQDYSTQAGIERPRNCHEISAHSPEPVNTIFNMSANGTLETL